MKTTIFLCLFAISSSVIAQETKKSGFQPYMMHGVGATFQEFEGLNSRIADFPQYKELKDHMATLQLGWLKEHDRVISAFSLLAGSSMSADKDERSSTIRFLGVGADLGYNVLKSARIKLYPMVGIGFEKYQAKFFKDNSAVDFNDVLESAAVQNNLRPGEFKNSFVTYRAGAGLSFTCPKMPAHSVGLQAGYVGSFKDHAWRSEYNQDVKNAPEDGIGRVFVSVVFLTRPGFMKH
jgi:hypothetical protein